MGCPWKRPRCQGMASTSSNQQQWNVAINEEQIEVEQKIIIYTPTFESKYLVMNYGTR